MARFVKILLSLPFLIAAVVFGLYTLGGFVAAPWWIKRELPQLLQTHLNATGSVGEIAINPFKFTVDVRDFAMTEAGGTQPAIAFDRLFVDFEASSLFRRAWTFADITLERPRANLEIDANGTPNLTKLKSQKPAPAKAAPKDANAELPRLLLEKFALKRGLVAFTDKTVSQAATAKFEPIEFELRDLSTLPNQHGDYTLAARLPAGGTLGWRGTLSLAPITSVGQVELKAVKLATLWPFVQDKVLIEEPGGNAGVALKYDARYAQGNSEASASDIAVKLSDITLKQKGAAQAALTVGDLALSGGRFDLAQRSVQFAELALAKITANTVIDSEGKANWAQLAAPGKPAAKPLPDAVAKPTAGAPWQLAIDAIKIAEVKLGIVDQVFVRPLAIDIARTAVNASLKASLGAETSATLDTIGIEVENLRVAEVGAKEPLLSLAAVTLAGGAFDLAQKRFSAQTLKLSKPVTAIIRDAKGMVNLAEAFARDSG
ncbi:MAG: DUF748 domain-containing protein [Betaproteobacteria bacterium]|nr:DUF748 domain-containing protein [Betaproteobacteria bacterium]